MSGDGDLRHLDAEEPGAEQCECVPHTCVDATAYCAACEGDVCRWCAQHTQRGAPLPTRDDGHPWPEDLP
jgi:hypothetical protein